jgi:hypothetical protein
MRTRKRLKAEQKVGYKNPPMRTRFKPGQSGNPAGRPKASKNFRTLMAELITQRVRVTENGKSRSIPAHEALLKRILAQALQGDAKSTEQMLKLWQTHSNSDDSEAASEDSAFADSEIIQETIDRLIRERKRRKA